MSEASQARHAGLKRVEALLCISLIFLKLSILQRQWGKVIGYDWNIWLQVMRWARWFEPLPATRTVGDNQHPPLSYLVGKLIYTFYPHEVEASQIQSTLAILTAFVALRLWLQRVGWLHTLPGLWLLYGSLSIPLFVYLGIETSYDALVFAWFMVALATSIALFWAPVSYRWWQEFKFCARLTCLGVVFACALLTKANGMCTLAIPFFIILVRRGLRGLLREMLAPLVAAVIGIVIVAPLFHHHFYKVEHRWVPISMEWNRPDDLVARRAQRDREPVKFVLHMLQWPLRKAADPRSPNCESFPDLIWTETWIKDYVLGEQPEPSLSLSVGYSKVFGWILGFGTLYFFVRQRQLPKEWRMIGWVLLLVAILFSIAELHFGWRFPLWDWRVFKAKYMSPAMLWIPYVTGIFFSERWFHNPRSLALRWLQASSFLLLVSFMFVNHLLPVY